MSRFNVRTPTANDKVHKDYCLYTFDTPLSDDGVYICMRNFFAVAQRSLALYHEKTGATTFLHWKQAKFRVDGVENGNSHKVNGASGPTRMAIGVAGGFDVEESHHIKTEDHYEVVLYPEMTRFALDDKTLPADVQASAAGIIGAQSAKVADQANAVWDGEVREVSRHSFDLLQLPTNGKTIPPSGWKCERCDLTKNLWLNLTDGSVLCGRRYADGSGGNNHALEHYQDVHYPLAVKLGTITLKGGDVYSYSEDDMVLDPNLPQHLAHWGIDINKIEKTDKTMAEMEIEVNSRLWEYRLLEQSDKKLTPVFGPGLTPIVNLGNTCYFNSVVQVLFSINDFVDFFAKKFEAFARQIAPGDCSRDLRFQLAKLGFALVSGEYSRDKTVKKANSGLCPGGIEPYTFKASIGALNAEYGSSRQQDAHEFMLFLLQQIDSFAGTGSPSKSFEFEMRQAIVAHGAGPHPLVKFMYTPEMVLSLNVDIEPLNASEFLAFENRRLAAEAAGEKIPQEQYVRKRYALESLIESISHPVELDGLRLSASGPAIAASSFSSMSTYPDCLVLHIKKFGLKPDWSPYKMDVEVEAPDVMDVESLFKKNELLRDVQNMKFLPEPIIEKGALDSLIEMGFSRNSCIKALYNTGGNGRRNLDAAINWIMEHSGDASIEEPLADPIQIVQSRPTGASSVGAARADAVGAKRRRMSGVSVELIEQIVGMGFTESQAKNALSKTNGNIERAIEHIFNNPDEALIEEDVIPEDSPATSTSAASSQLPQDPIYRTGAGKYELLGFISHMGSSPHSGHYVAHIRKNGQWVLFNDEHVTTCEDAPRTFGYLYFYKRI